MFYRLRNSFHYFFYDLFCRGILKTPPIASHPDGIYSIHSMLRERDVRMYLCAVKSFLSRLEGGAVYIHSDGSLSPRSIHLLERHLPRCRIITGQEAHQSALEHLSDPLRTLRSYGGCFDRLIDSVLFATGTCHLQLDADVITVAGPTAVCRWIDRPAQPILISDRRPRRSGAVPETTDHIQSRLEADQGPIAERFGTPIEDTYGLSAGFYGWRDELSLGEIERLATVCESRGHSMKRWGAEQVITTWLLRAHGGQRLPTEKYFNFDATCSSFVKSAHMVHFYGTTRFRGNLFLRLSLREIARLRKL